MRLHTLTVAAFGPFDATVSVDFDDLGHAGLFLLTGPTGAGKSSVLDAVCFALYGQVPGDRQAARQLRCDRAAPGAAPEVVLECSIRGRRFRFTRSPQWERPKKRGTGTTRVQAHVVVEEQRDGGWQGLTNRLDEAGLLVTDLLGMTCSQFTQVTMLPQGRFMTFLRAKSEERQKVLQALFRTDRFEQVERWLVDHRIELRRRSQAANDRVAGVLNRLQEAAGRPVPDDWDLADLALATEDGDVLGWAVRLDEEARRAAAATALRAREADAGAGAATERLARAEELASHQARGRQATVALESLDGSAARAAEDQRRLEAHVRALPVVRLAAGADSSTRAAEAAAVRARSALAAAAEVVEALETEPGLFPGGIDLAAAEEQATAALAVAEAFRPRQAELEQQTARCTALADQRLTLAAESERLQQELDTLPEQVARAAEACAAAQQAAHDLPAAVTTRATAVEAAGAVAELTAVHVELRAAEADVHAARDTAQALRERYLDIREARIHGMAAELAGGLAVGCACPVCGSAEHPSPAASGPDAVGRAEEEAARKDHEQAEFAHQLLAEKLTDLRTRAAVLEARTGGLDAPSAQAALHQAEDALAGLRTRAAQADRLQAALADLHARQARCAERRGAIQTSLEGVRSAHQAASDQVERLTAELAELLAGTPAESLEELVRGHRTAREAVVRARTAQHEHAVAEGAAHAARDAAEQAAGQAGFASLTTARAAALPDTEAVALEDALEQRRRDTERVAAVLADPAVAEAMAQEAPDLGALRTSAAAAVHERDQAFVAAEATGRRSSRLAALLGDLGRALDDWAPLRRDLATVTSLAALVEGKGPDNPLRMRLSAYVLGERLRQVVAAANERLDRMSGSRYVLEQSDDRGAGDVRGGLSLLVRDAWSGHTRDPATLSGGETFIVSLALALGLADTVCHEAGGTDIATLFIDEGFGTLDADTLDDVLDTLDGLREGGRVVGLVSHVAELRTRIPAQLEVSKGRQGSRLRAVVSSG